MIAFRMSEHVSQPLPDAGSILEHVFGYRTFRAGQEHVTNAILEGRDALVLLPTGGGKSLCYQVPAIVRFRSHAQTAIVISPLIALMNDQVAQLRGRNIPAAAIHSHLSDEAYVEAMEQLRQRRLAMLYVSPERAGSPRFIQTLARTNISLIAIDEAHCVAQWGHDFRPDYLKLSQLREVTRAPLIAVTATATPAVKEEIIANLKLKDPHVYVGDFSRPNLAFSVVHANTDALRFQTLEDVLESHGLRTSLGEGRAIVYGGTRKMVEGTAEHLKTHGFAVGYYHAGRTALTRERVERAFSQRKIRILVATNAFGMGIDYPDIRVVAHVQAPASLEAYYQEAGRASRDGERGTCVMFYGDRDIMMHKRMQQYSGVHQQGGGSSTVQARQQESLRNIQRYATSDVCRQKQLCMHFGQQSVANSCGCCDVCDPEESFEISSSDDVPVPKWNNNKRRAKQKSNPRQLKSITGVKMDLDSYRKKKARELKWKAYMVFQNKVIEAIDDARPQSLRDLEKISGLGPAKIEKFGKDILGIVTKNRR